MPSASTTHPVALAILGCGYVGLHGFVTRENRARQGAAARAVMIEGVKQASSLRRAAGGLSVGYGVGGALTYLFLSVCSHSMTPQEYGQIVILWTATFITFSVVSRPIEPVLTRSIAEADAQGVGSSHAVRSAIVIQAVMAAGFVIVALLARERLIDDLFAGDEVVYWAFLAAVPGFSAAFLVRSVLIGHGEPSMFAIVVVTEGAVRLAAAVLAAAFAPDRLEVVALGLALAPYVSTVPFLVRGLRQSTGSNEETARSRRIPDALVTDGIFALSAALILLSEQIFISAGPLIVNHEEGAAAAGLSFNVLLWAIGPLLLFQPIAQSLLPHLTRAASDSSVVSSSIGQVPEAVGAFAFVVAVIAVTIGPLLMRVALGNYFDYRRGELLVVVAGMGFYLAATTSSQAALAREQARKAALRWVIAGCAFWRSTPSFRSTP